MEVDEFVDHGAYYDVHIRSNLAEGTCVQGDVEISGYESAGFTEITSVLPDGSFQLFIQAPDLDDEEINIKIEVLPGRFILSDTEELYGENGEYFKGDLVEKYQDGQKIEYIFSVNDFN